jgi:phenylpropionate dioxygenase-like ring-hydroxylating dioxygenase large terminal subunit
VGDWVAVLDASAIAVGDVVEVTCHGEDLLLYRTADSSLHAATAYCPHQKNYMPNGLPPGHGLDGLLHEDELLCPYHGWRFNAQGQCSHIPPGQRVPPAVRAGRTVLRRWDVREEEGRIKVRDPRASGSACR